MNQADEECRDPFLPSSSVIGKRLSLTDLFCTEPFIAAPSSPCSLLAGLSEGAAAVGPSCHHQLPTLNRPGVEALAPPFASTYTPHGGFFISATNPFLPDILTNSDPELLAPYHYLHEQFEWKHSMQSKYRVDDYLASHPNVTSTMRAELIIWLGNATRQLRYDIETYLLAINFIDRFLAGTLLIPADKLQLLGLAALLVAAKKEEDNPPDVDELIGLSGQSYPAHQIREMEIWLLKKLDFQLCAPTVSYFFEYYMTFTKEYNIDVSGVRELFHQLLESSFVHYELLHYSPSTVAAAALCLCQRFLPSLLPVEPLYWLVEIYSSGVHRDGHELVDIQRCLFDMSLWQHQQSQLCWATRVVAGNNVQSSANPSSCTYSQQAPSVYVVNDMLTTAPMPIATNNPFNTVDLCNQFAHFSIAPH